MHASYIRQWLLFLAALFFGVWAARAIIYGILAWQLDAMVFHIGLLVFSLVIAVDYWPTTTRERAGSLSTVVDPIEKSSPDDPGSSADRW
ncbi:hypothetical protein GF377_02925 [candidate division GN15 bacterium]|nr:hypothetical protein [candidate division GN15 bacterium]